MLNNKVQIDEIKYRINQKLKLIRISYKGIKFDKKRISIERILQNLSNEISIPAYEGYNFFDLKNARENIQNSKAGDEYKEFQMINLNHFEEEFNKMKENLLLMKNYKNIIENKLIKGSYADLKLVYSSDLKIINEINQRLIKEQKDIDIKKFESGLTDLIESFRYKIRGELSRHHIEENEELTLLLEECFKDVKDAKKLLNKLNVKCLYIVDLSYEVLNDKKFKNLIMDTSIEDNDKELFNKYYNLM